MLALSKMRSLSLRDFALFGRTEMAYVKPVKTNGVPAYAVHAADGTYIWRFADRDLACAALRRHRNAVRLVSAKSLSGRKPYSFRMAAPLRLKISEA